MLKSQEKYFYHHIVLADKPYMFIKLHKDNLLESQEKLRLSIDKLYVKKHITFKIFIKPY